MHQNPYRTPNHVAVVRNPKSIYPSIVIILWIFFLFVPSITVLIVRIAHLAQFLERPSGDTILSRWGIILRVPLEPLLIVSFFGYLLTTIGLPFNRTWKFGILAAWIPLTIIQFVILVIILGLLGERWQDI
jgi:hypothetical protein